MMEDFCGSFDGVGVKTTKQYGKNRLPMYAQHEGNVLDCYSREACAKPDMGFWARLGYLFRPDSLRDAFYKQASAIVTAANGSYFKAYDDAYKAGRASTVRPAEKPAAEVNAFRARSFSPSSRVREVHTTHPSNDNLSNTLLYSMMSASSGNSDRDCSSSSSDYGSSDSGSSSCSSSD